MYRCPTRNEITLALPPGLADKGTGGIVFKGFPFSWKFVLTVASLETLKSDPIAVANVVFARRCSEPASGPSKPLFSLGFCLDTAREREKVPGF